MAGSDIEAEKRRYRAKIAEWEKLGFDVTGLEGLLDTDFEEFKRRKSQILLGQYKTGDDGAEDGKQPAKKRPVHTVPKTAKKRPEEDVATIIIVGPEPESPSERAEAPEEEAAPPQAQPEPVAEPGKASPDAPQPILIGAPLTPKEKSIELKPTGEVVSPEPKAPKRAQAPETIEIKMGEDEEEPRSERPGQGRSVRKAAPRDSKKVGFADEEEGPEEDSRPGRPSKAPKGEGQFNWKIIGIIAALAVVAIVVLAVWKYYPEAEQKEPLVTVSITADQPSVIAAGIEQCKNVSFYAKVVCDDPDVEFRYRWIYSSSSFIVESGSETAASINGYFKTLGSNTIGLDVGWTWNDADYSRSTAVDISVSAKVVNIVREQYGQRIQYDTYGNLKMTGMDMQFDTFLISGMDLDFTTDFTDEAFSPSLKVLDSEPHKDGFGVEHKVFERTEVMNLALTGTASATSDGGSNADLDLTGSLVVTKKDLIAMYSSQTVCSMLDSAFTLALKESLGETMSFTSIDNVESFPDLSKDQTSFRLEDLSEQRKFKVDDQDTRLFGSTAYNWRAEDVERVEVADGTTRDTIRLYVTIASDTMEQNNILEFTMNLWIQEGRPAAVKSYLYLKKENDDGSIATLTMTQSERSFLAGSLPITYRSASDAPSASPKRLDELNPAYAPEFSDGWTYLPGLGGMRSSISSFPASEAIDGLETDAGTSQTWSSYMTSKADPYATVANVTEESGALQWSFSFADRDSKQTLNASASDAGAYSAYVHDGSQYPDYRTSDFDPLISFSGAQSAIGNATANLTSDKLVADARADMYSGSELDLNGYRFGVRTSIATPSLDMTSATYFLFLDYGYVIEGKDPSDSYSLALDAQTGQLAYVWYHKDQQTGFQNPFDGLF